MKAKKIIITLLIIIVALAAMLVIYGYTQPKEVEVARSIIIDKDVETVFNHVNDFRNWKSFDPWSMSDSTMETTYSGSETGEGAVMSWTSENQGSGKQTIVESIEYEVIKTDLDFGDQGLAKSEWHFEEVDGGTKVTWTFWTEIGNPFMRGILGLFMDMEGMITESYDQGLENLKNHIEALPEKPSPEEMMKTEMNEETDMSADSLNT